MSKKMMLTAGCLALVFGALTGWPALAAEGEGEGSVGIQVFIELVTLIVIGGTIFNLWISSTGFGGLLGKVFKIVSVGIFLLSLEVLDEVIEGLTSVGSETLLGDGLLHDVVHHGVVLLGFVFLAVGVSMLGKFVKSTKA